MSRRNLFYIFILIGLAVPLVFCSARIFPDADLDGLPDMEETKVYRTDPENADTDSDGYNDGLEIENGFSPLNGCGDRLRSVNLEVPYINEAPDDNWTGPWKNACEESSITMVEKYYLGLAEVGITKAKDFMQTLFDHQNNLYGSNADADAERTARLINDFSVFGALIKDNPSVEDIKNEINGRRPVITLHYGFDLGNKNIPFLSTGSSYHMMVVVGYDDVQKEFITNDPGDRYDGKNHRYGYDLFMNTLHDFDFSDRQANGPARVIFTYPKLAKTAGSPRIFYIDGEKYHYITTPAVFASHKWDWAAVNTVGDAWLTSFVIGPNIVK